MEPDEVPGLDMAPGVAFGLGDVQLPFCAMVSDMLELADDMLDVLDDVPDVPAVGEGQGDAAFAVVV